LANEKENLVICQRKASANYSFNKGTSVNLTQFDDGYIAFASPDLLDAAWYKTKPFMEGFNAYTSILE
jgi:hypothetical protein